MVRDELTTADLEGLMHALMELGTLQRACAQSGHPNREYSHTRSQSGPGGTFSHVDVYMCSDCGQLSEEPSSPETAHRIETTRIGGAYIP